MKTGLLEKLGCAVRKRRNALGLSQIQVCKIANVAQANLSRLEKGHSRPAEDAIERIAHALNTSVAQLYIEAEGFNVGNVSPAPELVERVPLIGYVEAGNFSHVRELEVEKVEEWYPAMKHFSGTAFALRVVGESMTSPTGRSYPQGCIAVFNLAKKTFQMVRLYSHG